LQPREGNPDAVDAQDNVISHIIPTSDATFCTV
jgi:hypothetical protein